MTSVADLPLLELESDSGETFRVDDPATGELVREVPRMGAAETTRALQAAADALPAWRGLLAKERARIMRRWSDLMLENAEPLTRLLTTEQGKPIAEARTTVRTATGTAAQNAVGSPPVNVVTCVPPVDGGAVLAPTTTVGGGRGTVVVVDGSWSPTTGRVRRTSRRLALLMAFNTAASPPFSA